MDLKHSLLTRLYALTPRGFEDFRCVAKPAFGVTGTSGVASALRLLISARHLVIVAEFLSGPGAIRRRARWRGQPRR